MIHPLIVLLIWLAIIGLILWAIGQIPGLPPFVRVIGYVIAVLILLLWLLQIVGPPSSLTLK